MPPNLDHRLMLPGLRIRLGLRLMPTPSGCHRRAFVLSSLASVSKSHATCSETWLKIPVSNSERRISFRVMALSAALFFCAAVSQAGAILLNEFSGQETVINISEIPAGGLQGSLAHPPGNWSRLVRGVYFNRGNDFFLGGRTNNGDDGGNPFRQSPLGGDPDGFSTASYGSWLDMTLPSGFALDFSGLSEMPRRVGLNLEAVGYYAPGYYLQTATLRVDLHLMDASVVTQLYDTPIRQLLAFESSEPISEMRFSWATSFTGNGPGMAIDDIRFEAVPEPSSLGLTVGGLFLASWAVRHRRRSA
jgi:hypothetical protein